MKETIEARELIVLDGLIRGTYHKTHNDVSGVQSNLIERDRIGVLFLTGLAATRASNGDGAVYWADAFAEHGYPSFRLDLPGCGDSEGDSPAEGLDFIDRGGYAPIVAAKIKELVARFNLSGVVIVGHCSGTASAIYTGAVSKECKGLVLMDPYFHMQQVKLPKFRRQIHAWALQVHLDGLLSKIYNQAKEFFFFFRGSALPENANFALLRSWKEVVSAGRPVLILRSPGRNAPGTKTRVGEFDYLKYVLELAGRKSQVIVEVAEGANHSFANHLGRVAVRQHTEYWLNTHFPLANREDSSRDAAKPNPAIAI